MRWLLIYELLTIGPGHVTWERGHELHATEYACRLALAELQALTRMHAACRPVGGKPREGGSVFQMVRAIT